MMKLLKPKKKFPKLVFGVATTRCKKMLLYDMAWSHTNFECLLVEESSIYLACATKVPLLNIKSEVTTNQMPHLLNR